MSVPVKSETATKSAASEEALNTPLPSSDAPGGSESISAIRLRLLRDVRSIADTLNEGGAPSDGEGQLVKASVAALTEHGFWRMRLCRELGGFELPIVTQIEVLSALAAEDTSSAWCTMVANNGLAMLGDTMPAAAVKRVFAEGVPRCSIVASPGGSATPTEGGYRLNGTWRLASSIRHAAWVYATALVERDPSRVLPLAIPAADVELLNTWDVVGLAGTGSHDFKLTDYFLPAELAGREDAPFAQVRGTRRYDLVQVEHLESYEHLAFAIGVARRALHELCAVFSKPVPGRYVADREIVEDEMGKAVVRLHAVEALAHALFTRIDAAACGEPQSWLKTERHLPRALASWATSLALECVQLAFHRAGLAALRKPNLFEKLLRDMSIAATHVVVDDLAFPTYAQHLIETGAPLGLGAFTFNRTAQEA